MTELDYTPGNILFVKSTEEPVVVIVARSMTEADSKRFPAYNGSQTIVVTRRPVYSESTGTRYQFFDFLAEELESGDEQARRRYANIKARQEMVMKDFPGALQDTGFAADNPLGLLNVPKKPVRN